MKKYLSITYSAQTLARKKGGAHSGAAFFCQSSSAFVQNARMSSADRRPAK